MLPKNVGIPSKGKHSVVGLRKVYLDLVTTLLWGSADKGQFAGGTKGRTDRNVLILGSFGIKGSDGESEGGRDGQGE